MIIYGLFDPDTDEIKYVGATKKTLHRRMQKHLSDANNISIRKCNRLQWIESLLNKGKKPVGKVLEIYSDELDKFYELEKQWIKKVRETGAELLNETDGGIGGFGRVVSDESKLKCSISNTGKKRSEEFCQKMKDLRKRKPTILKGADHPMYGKTASDETKRKMSETHKNGDFRGENCPYSKLDNEKVIAIFLDNRTQAVIAHHYNISTSNVSLIKLRKRWAHITNQL